MKKLISIYLTLLVSVLVMFSCKEDFPDREDSPGANPNSQGVFFPRTDEINLSDIEIDPAEPTEIVIVIARTKTENAMEVPINVVVNDDDKFVVPTSVSFAAGEDTIQFTVSFPTAEVGETYKLTVSLSGDEFVNPYVT